MKLNDPKQVKPVCTGTDMTALWGEKVSKLGYVRAPTNIKKLPAESKHCLTFRCHEGSWNYSHQDGETAVDYEQDVEGYTPELTTQ